MVELCVKLDCFIDQLSVKVGGATLFAPTCWVDEGRAVLFVRVAGVITFAHSYGVTLVTFLLSDATPRTLLLYLQLQMMLC